MALWKRTGIYYVKLAAPNETLPRHSTGTINRKKAELWDITKLNQKSAKCLKCQKGNVTKMVTLRTDRGSTW